MNSYKKRTVNFSAKEVDVLMNLVLKFKNTIECRKTDKMNNELKQKAWEQLSNEFNCICGEPYREATVLRGKYENQKKRSKQKFADEKCYLRGTGGGPPTSKTFDDIDQKVKEIIGTQMTGFESEFGGDCKRDTVQIMDMESGSDLLEADAKGSENEDISLSEVTSKRRKMEASEVTLQACKSSPSSWTVAPTDWSKMTPEKLRTPKSKPLKTALRVSGKENKHVLPSKVTLWATNKAETASQQREFLEKEHLLRLDMMKERHQHQIALETKESDARILILNRKADLELEILRLQKEKLLREATKN